MVGPKIDTAPCVAATMPPHMAPCGTTGRPVPAEEADRHAAAACSVTACLGLAPHINTLMAEHSGGVGVAKASTVSEHERVGIDCSATYIIWRTRTALVDLAMWRGGRRQRAERLA